MKRSTFYLFVALMRAKEMASGDQDEKEKFTRGHNSNGGVSLDSRSKSLIITRMHNADPKRHLIIGANLNY